MKTIKRIRYTATRDNGYVSDTYQGRDDTWQAIIDATNFDITVQNGRSQQYTFSGWKNLHQAKIKAKDMLRSVGVVFNDESRVSKKQKELMGEDKR